MFVDDEATEEDGRPRVGKFSCAKSASRFICRDAEAKALLDGEGAPQVACCCCGLLADVVIAANCLLVAPMFPRIAFFFLFWLEALDVGSVGKDS